MHLAVNRVFLAAATGLTRGARRQARADMGKKSSGPTVNSRETESKTRGCPAAAYSKMRGSVQWGTIYFVVFDYDYVNIKKKEFT